MSFPQDICERYAAIHAALWGEALRLLADGARMYELRQALQSMGDYASRLERDKPRLAALLEQAIAAKLAAHPGDRCVRCGEPVQPGCGLQRDGAIEPLCDACTGAALAAGGEQ